MPGYLFFYLHKQPKLLSIRLKPQRKEGVCDYARTSDAQSYTFAFPA